MRILLIEDDSRISANLKAMLTEQSYSVDIADSGESGLDKALVESYDLLIVDWMLPDLSGPEVIASLRKESSPTPILMLTAKSQLEDVVEGLDSGADDYLTKPFQMHELLARVRSLLRRSSSAVITPVIQIADLTIDTNLHRVTRSGKELILSPKEYALLEYLARHVNVSLERLDILSHVWDENTDPFTNTVDVHIRYLRKKVDDPYKVHLIQTVKGKGYAICEP